MKNWRNLSILILGVLLITAAFVAYAGQVDHTRIPLGATQAEVQLLTEKYGLDRPPAAQYGLCLVLFLSGLTVVTVYGTLGIRRAVNPLFILVRAFLLLLLITNAITACVYLLEAPQVQPFSLGDFSLKMVLVGLAVANCAFCLVIWNGRRWGFWGFCLASLAAFILALIGHVPVVPSLFAVSAPVILYYLIRISGSSLK